MAANYAKIYMVGGLDAVFNKFHLFKISEIFTIILQNIHNLKSVKKSQKTFFQKSS